MNLSARILVGIALLGGAFAWGVLSAHRGIFPHSTIERLIWSPGDGEDGGSGGPLIGGEEERQAERRAGLWHIARSRTEADGAPDRDAVEALADLPYLSGYEAAPGSASVTLFERDRASEGLNLVVSGHAPEVYLMDMEGRVLHRWRHELHDVWPEMAREQELGGFEAFFRRAHLLPDGGLLAIYDGLGLVRLDRDSELVWAHAGGEHHDLFVDEEGDIHVLTRRTRTGHPDLEIDGSIEEDFISVLTANGELKREFSILQGLIDSDYASFLTEARRSGDILHTNTIELLDGRFVDRHPLYASGNYLISMPRINAVAVVEGRRQRVIWALAGLWRFQHQPTVLNDGRLLVFDNTGSGGDSRVVEVDPLTQEIVWSYEGTSERRFTSYFLGSSQRLKNGNTLITESTAGRAFEVTTDGDIVWEYLNPHRAGDDGELIASLLEVVRIPRAELKEDFLRLLGAAEVSR